MTPEQKAEGGERPNVDIEVAALEKELREALTALQASREEMVRFQTLYSKEHEANVDLREELDDAREETRRLREAVDNLCARSPNCLASPAPERGKNPLKESAALGSFEPDFPAPEREAE